MTMALRHRPRGLSSASPREVTILQLLDWALQKEEDPDRLRSGRQ